MESRGVFYIHDYTYFMSFIHEAGMYGIPFPQLRQYPYLKIAKECHLWFIAVWEAFLVP